MTDDELKQLKADDFLKLKLTTEEKIRLRYINQKRQMDRSARSFKIREEEEPLLVDLRGVGIDVKSVWDLVENRIRYSTAIPVLLKHLQFSYSDRIKEGIARALAVVEPEVCNAWAVIVSEYRQAPTGDGPILQGDSKVFRLGAKDALAFVLAVIVTEATLVDLIALAKDRSQGESRILLLSGLRKFRPTHPLARQAINELASDPQLAVEIASWRINSVIT